MPLCVTSMPPSDYPAGATIQRASLALVVPVVVLCCAVLPPPPLLLLGVLLLAVVLQPGLEVSA